VGPHKRAGRAQLEGLGLEGAEGHERRVSRPLGFGDFFRVDAVELVAPAAERERREREREREREGGRGRERGREGGRAGRKEGRERGERREEEGGRVRGR